MTAVDPRNKKKEEEDGEMGIFYNLSRIMKLVLFILIIDGTSKQHKRMAQKVFNQSLKGLGGFYSILCVCSIRDFDKIFGQSLL